MWWADERLVKLGCHRKGHSGRSWFSQTGGSVWWGRNALRESAVLVYTPGKEPEVILRHTCTCVEPKSKDSTVMWRGGREGTETPPDCAPVAGEAKGSDYPHGEQVLIIPTVSRWAVPPLASGPPRLLQLVLFTKLAFLIFPHLAGGIWLVPWGWVLLPWWQWWGLAFASQELGRGGVTRELGDTFRTH